jgi:hypothetical protein
MSGEIDNTQTSTTHYCDFCGTAMTSGDYHVLSDGLEQCKVCFSTAIDTIEEKIQFRQTLQKVKELMQVYFNVTIKLNRVLILFVSTTLIARIMRKKFVPTPNFDTRHPAAAGKSIFNLFYTIFLEEGTPFANAVLNAIHELAHIWQFQNWSFIKGWFKYGKDFPLVYEGMAVWTQMQYLLLSQNEEVVALGKRYVSNYLKLENEYGWGLYNYMKQYPLAESLDDLKVTPFNTKICSETKPLWPIRQPLERPKRDEMRKIMLNDSEKREEW